MAPRLAKSQWTVRAIDIAVARRLVEREHYARGAPNTATFLHGLFRIEAFWDEECVGVAWWIPPTRSAAEATFPANWLGVLSLSRLAITAEAPRNAASFLISRSRRLIDRARWPCLVTYADQMQGHTGAIYRADNWTYLGLTKPEAAFTVRGRLTARKAGGHTRTRAEMAQIGAESLGKFAKHKFVHIVA